MIEVHIGYRGPERKGYPIPWGADNENSSAKVLKFKLSLKGNLKMVGRTIWARMEGTLCTRSRGLTGWRFKKLELIPRVWLKGCICGCGMELGWTGNRMDLDYLN